MGTFKNITDVTVKLLQRKSASRIRGEILKIQTCAAAMQSTYAAALERQSQIMTENLELKRINRELQEQLSLAGNVEFHYQASWVRRPDGSLDGPFSPGIWDLERKLVRMQLSRRSSSTFEFVCEQSHRTSIVPFNFMAKHQVLSEDELKFPPIAA